MSRLIYNKMMNYSVNRASKNCYPYGKKMNSYLKLYTFIPHFILLCRYCIFFLTWRFVATLPQAKLWATFFFPLVFASFMSLCHILIIFRIFQTLLFLLFFFCYCDLWGVIFDVTILIVLGLDKWWPYNTMNLINIVCLWLLHWSASAPFLYLFFSFPLP